MSLIRKKEKIKFGRLILNDCFLPDNLNISSRQINYWRNCNVLPFFQKEKKGFMNMSEALWLLIINELSKVGVSTKKMQRLSHEIWVIPFEDKYAEGVFDKVFSENKLDKYDKKAIEELIKFEPIMNSIFRKEMNPFIDTMKSCINSERNFGSMVYCPKTGEYYFNLINVGFANELKNMFNGETLIIIPYLPLLTKLIGIEIEKSNSDLEYLSSVENQIRRVLFFDKPKLMEIILHDAGQTIILKITEEHKKSEELAKFFLSNNLSLDSEIIIESRIQGKYKITITSKN